MRRFLAFDLETAKIVPEPVVDLLAHRPLGIACATATANDLQQPFIWHGRDAGGRPASRMTREEAADLVHRLSALTSQGYTLVTWNGLYFDFNVLAEESGLIVDCARLATGHVDMMFHVLCSVGYRVGLEKAAEGMQLPGKKAGVSGADAPAMWAAGRYDEVLDYCIQDANLTLQLAETCEHRKQLAWITRRRKLSQMPLPHRWLTVQEARVLPLPDTSWMSDPEPRDRFLRWLADARSANG
jgi:hypothetical protein